MAHLGLPSEASPWEPRRLPQVQLVSWLQLSLKSLGLCEMAAHIDGALSPVRQGTFCRAVDVAMRMATLSSR